MIGMSKLVKTNFNSPKKISKDKFKISECVFFSFVGCFGGVSCPHHNLTAETSSH